MASEIAPGGDTPALTPARFVSYDAALMATHCEGSRVHSEVSPPTPTIKPERLVTFVDAVIAIAITLLVLPLVDLVPSAAAHGQSPSALVHDNLHAIAAFVVSFATIVQLWIANHGLMRRLTTISPAFITLTMFWLLLVVFLPFVTQMVGVYGNNPFVIRLYTAVWLLLAATHPGLGALGGAFRRRMLMWPVVLVICLVLEFTLPQLGYYPLLLLVIAPLLVVSAASNPA